MERVGIEKREAINHPSVEKEKDVYDSTVSSNFAPVILSEAWARQLDKMFRFKPTVPIL
jgi:hypothetical protein